jgi:hypothetical protein
MRGQPLSRPGARPRSVDLTLPPGELHVLVGEAGRRQVDPAPAPSRARAARQRPDPHSGRAVADRLAPDCAAPRHRRPAGTAGGGRDPDGAESVVLGAEPGRLLLARRRAAERAVALGDELGLSLGPHAWVRALTPAERHQVELLALAHRGASVLLWTTGSPASPKTRRRSCSSRWPSYVRPAGPFWSPPDRADPSLTC